VAKLSAFITRAMLLYGRVVVIFFYFLKYMHLIKQLISQKLRLRQIVCILRREYVWLVLPFLGRHIKNEVSKAHKVQAKIYRTGTTLLKLGKSIRQNVARLFMLH